MNEANCCSAGTTVTQSNDETYPTIHLIGASWQLPTPVFSLAGVLVTMVMLFLSLSFLPLAFYVRPSMDVQDASEKPVISLRVLPRLDARFTPVPRIAGY